MLTIKFNKDYPQSGHKAGDVIKVKGPRLNHNLIAVAEIVKEEGEDSEIKQAVKQKAKEKSK